MKTLEYYKTRKRHPTTKTNAHRLMEDTPESNYWLGYLLTDGHFGLDGQIRLEQFGRDRPAVEYFAKFIHFKGNIYTQKKGHNLTATFTDAELCRDYCLKWNIARGTLKNKTTKTYIPPNFDHIKSRLVCHKSFLAGLISGDGSIRRGRCYIKMHKNYLPLLQNINPEAKLVEVGTGDNSRSIDPLQAFCYIDVDEMQEIYQTCTRHKIPLIKEKWLPVIERIEKIEQKTADFDNRRVTIQDLVAAGLSQRKIAKKLGVSKSLVGAILKGKRK